MDVPVLGIVENMSQHVCSNCGHVEPVFGHGGAKDEAERLGLPFLGGVPLDIKLRKSSDRGTPIVILDPDHPASLVFKEMADTVLKSCVDRAVKS
jgi:ATP-binding protein involved in chromosome partitioning